MTDTGSSSGGHHYTYDALGQQTQVDYGTTASYTYDGAGARVRKDTASYGSTEYIRFGGLVVAETNPGVSWTDYIYANGQKVAKADSYDQRIHISGNNCTTCGWQWTGFSTSNPTQTRPIQAGDALEFRQLNTGAACGGIYLGFSGGGGTDFTTVDQNNVLGNEDNALGAWHSRRLPLDAFAGQSIVSTGYLNEGCSGPGAWDIYFADAAITGTDGTVWPIFNHASTVSLSHWGSSTVSGVSGVSEQSNTASNTNLAQCNITYYVADHLGSARVEFAGGGWPVWGEDYAPYGQEVTPQSTQNHYKFTGYERDPETGNDYAQARYYSSQYAGRFMSPDPYAGSMVLANPQSFNRYTYAMNNPLRFTDPSGMDACVYDNGDGTGTVYYDEAGGCGGDGYYVDGGAAAETMRVQEPLASALTTTEISHGRSIVLRTNLTTTPFKVWGAYLRYCKT